MISNRRWPRARRALKVGAFVGTVALLFYIVDRAGVPTITTDGFVVDSHTALRPVHDAVGRERTVRVSTATIEVNGKTFDHTTTTETLPAGASVRLELGTGRITGWQYVSGVRPLTRLDAFNDAAARAREKLKEARERLDELPQFPKPECAATADCPKGQLCRFGYCCKTGREVCSESRDCCSYRCDYGTFSCKPYEPD
jgi:hypothetical protein